MHRFESDQTTGTKLVFDVLGMANFTIPTVALRVTCVWSGWGMQCSDGTDPVFSLIHVSNIVQDPIYMKTKKKLMCSSVSQIHINLHEPEWYDQSCTKTQISCSSQSGLARKIIIFTLSCRLSSIEVITSLNPAETLKRRRVGQCCCRQSIKHVLRSFFLYSSLWPSSGHQASLNSALSAQLVVHT